MYWVFRLAALLLPRLPRWLMNILGNMLGVLIWLLAGKARKQASANMRQILGSQGQMSHAGRRRLRRTVRRMFQYSSRNYLGAFALPSLDTDDLLQRVHVHGLEHLEAALALGKGVILFSAHLGPFNELVHWLAIKGYPTTIPVERLQDKRMLTLMLDLRRSQGINFLPLGGSAPLREVFSALRHNHLVLITVDRTSQGRHVEKPFFGAKAYLPLGPVQLAQRTGAILVGAFGWYGAGRRIEAQFVPLSLDLPEPQRADGEQLMDGMVEQLEQFIAAHPEQWVVFSPVWSNQVSETV